MGLIRVTASTLRSEASNLSSLNATFKANVDDLESTETSLMGMWDGEAKDAFHQAFNSDKAQFSNFYNLIEKYVVSLEDIAAKYEQAEATNLSTATTRTY